MSKGDTKAKKVEYFDRMRKLLADYSKILIVEADNVGSQQFHNTRISLRGQAIILMGKNTMMRKVLRQEAANNAALEKLLPLVRGNVGFVFTNEDLREVRDKLLAQRVAAPAKAGAIAPLDVFIDPLNTGMGPEKTSFFQALGIATKITKGTIEIQNRVHLITKGNKVGPSEAALLNMLNMSPFTYGLQISSIYDNGAVYGADILDITDDVLLGHFAAGVSRVASLSLGANIPSAAAAGHSIVNGFKNLLAIAAETEITFKAAEQMKEYLKDPSKFAAAAAAAAPAAAAPAAAAPAKKEEPKEESDEDMGFGLFD